MGIDIYVIGIGQNNSIPVDEITSGNNLPWVKDQTNDTTWSLWSATNRDLYILGKNDEIIEVVNLSNSFDETYIKSVIDNLINSLDGNFISIENVNTSDGTLDVVMYNESDVAGFQFNVDGVTILGASGGNAEINDFTVSTSATTVLGFSFIGDIIPIGGGVLVELSFTGTSNDICINNVVLSDSEGNLLDVMVGDCYESRR